MNKILSAKIRRLTPKLGIDVIGFTNTAPFSDDPLNTSVRQDPKRSMPSAKTIIVAGIYIGGFTLPVWQNTWYGRTSRLFLSGFFLDIVKPLEPIVDLLKTAGFKAMICDGSIEKGSILPLKRAAVRAGLGWQGKHSLLISKQYGTFLALGGIITNAELEHNIREETNRCKSCDKCQKACPLSALDQPYVLNKSACMSNRLQNRSLSENVKKVMENRIVDCEICQEVCPWNKKQIKNPLDTPMSTSFQHQMKDWEKFFYLPDLIELSEERYRKTIGRLNTDIPYERFHRNVFIAMGNIAAHDTDDGYRDGHK